MKKIATIIQARMGSMRLPNKVLSEIEGKSMLWHLVNRLKHAKKSSETIIATTISEDDKKILDFAEENNLKSYAGSVNDVLDRYYQTALKYNIDVVVRITADCPLIDPQVFDEVIEVFLENDCDYASNTHPPTYPDGLDLEIFSFEALERAWKVAKLASEREHVTPYIWKNQDLFKQINIHNDEDLSYMRWTVDEKRDLQHYIPVHYHSFYQQKFGLKKGILPNVEWLFPRLFTIPLFPKMTDDDINDVINALEKVLTYYKK